MGIKPIMKVLDKHNLKYAHITGDLSINKRQEAVLNSKESELVVAISELLSFGQEVFNNEEEKFNRWLEMPNQSLNGITPQSLFDTLSGVAEVRKCLNRIEYGNFA